MNIRDELLSQYLIHHGDLDERSFDELTDRLGRVLRRVEEMCRGRERDSGGEVLSHLTGTTMELASFGKLVDFPCLEAALLHDAVEDGYMDGEELKRDFPDVKIIAISGGGRIEPDSYLAIAKRFGVVHTFEKPIEIKALLEVINERLAIATT